MAGNGPAPKLPEQRRRRNAPAAGEWVTLPSDAYSGPVPPMPDLDSEFARWTWAQWWTSPMAHMWDEGDWPGLIRLICMLDSDSPKLETLKEVRLQEDRFGLSPKGRQGLRWRLPADHEDERGGAVLSGRWSELRVVEDTDGRTIRP